LADPDDRLALDPETMRALGYRTVDMLVDQLAAVPAGPALRRASPAQMRERLPALPDEARQFEALLGELERDVLPYMSRCEHPGYFAFIPACGTWPAALGDFIASALNIYAGSWMEAAGPSRVEQLVLDKFKQWIGYPEQAAGVLVSGGSAANMTALACAREALLRRPAGSGDPDGSRGPDGGAAGVRGVAYVSDQAHSSVARASRALGMRPDELRVLPSDGRHRLRPDALAGAIAADVRRGRTPLFVAAAAGSTNTGAIDPLHEIAAICQESGAWLHVDAAYGGFAALTERGRTWLAGIELADSVTLDPHKWLYQPFECGCVLVRDGERLRTAFEVVPDYLKDAAARAGEVNFSDLGFQLTRSSRALKVWLSLGYFGVDAFRTVIDRCLDLAEHAERLVEATAELELLSPAQLGIVCFRRRFRGVEEEWRATRLGAALVGRFEKSGLGLVSSTTLDGRYAIRLCILNHTTTERDVERAIEWFAQSPVPSLSDPSAQLALSVEDRAPSVIDGWSAGEPPAFGLEEVAAMPLFAELPPAHAARVARWSRELFVGPGERVAERWDSARDFYVIVSGEAEVLIEDEHVRGLGPGDFFGEVAALDWGSGFGYVRTATVVAASDMRLLALGPERLGVLIRGCPALGEKIHATARERMRRI
jgi:aromatic-L-amino-acid decarboxylase